MASPVSPSSASSRLREQLLARHIPFRQGGRDPADGLDCLGVVLLGAIAFGLPWRDPWQSIREQWLAGERPIGSSFPDGWFRLQDVSQPRAGDIAIYRDENGPDGHVGIVLDDDTVLSARMSVGVCAVPFARVASSLSQLWRFARC